MVLRLLEIELDEKKVGIFRSQYSVEPVSKSLLKSKHHMCRFMHTMKTIRTLKIHDSLMKYQSYPKSTKIDTLAQKFCLCNNRIDLP